METLLDEKPKKKNSVKLTLEEFVRQELSLPEAYELAVKKLWSDYYRINVSEVVKTDCFIPQRTMVKSMFVEITDSNKGWKMLDLTKEGKHLEFQESIVK